MEYQFIQKGEEQLFSIYHEPTTMGNIDTGVILCNPLGQEFIRCHKLYVNLANRLAAKGYHVMRFDYAGTGDSSGEFESFSIKEGLKDIAVVAEELKATFGVSKIILIGTRFGGTLSLLYADRFKVDGVALLSPVMEGADYLNTIKKEYKSWLGGSFTKENIEAKEGFSSFGFMYSNELANTIESVSFGNQNFNKNFPILMISADDQFEHQHMTNVSFEKTLNDEFWMKREGENAKSMVPLYEINKIVDWIELRK